MRLADIGGPYPLLAPCARAFGRFSGVTPAILRGVAREDLSAEAARCGVPRAFSAELDRAVSGRRCSGELTLEDLADAAAGARGVADLLAGAELCEASPDGMVGGATRLAGVEL